MARKRKHLVEVRELFDLCIIIISVFCLSFPVAYSISSNFDSYVYKHAFIWSTVPVIYALVLYSRRKIQQLIQLSLLAPISFGWIIGLFLYSMSIVLLSYMSESNVLIYEDGFRYYTLGLIVPLIYPIYRQVSYTVKQMKKEAIKEIFFDLLILLTIFTLLLCFIAMDIIFFHKDSTLFQIILSFFLGSILSTFSLLFIHRYIRSSLNAFIRISLYLRIMSKPVIAFFLGYLSLAIFFGGVYFFVIKTIPNAIEHPDNYSILDSLIYSYKVLSNVGNSNFASVSRFATMLTQLENFLGLMWITVVFAATIGYLHKPFKDISKQIAKLVDKE